jgi:hypothetical protein
LSHEAFAGCRQRPRRCHLIDSVGLHRLVLLRVVDLERLALAHVAEIECEAGDGRIIRQVAAHAFQRGATVAQLDGPYRIVDVAPVPERPGTVRVTLRAVAAGGQDETALLYLPQQLLRLELSRKNY